MYRNTLPISHLFRPLRCKQLKHFNFARLRHNATDSPLRCFGCAQSELLLDLDRHTRKSYLKLDFCGRHNEVSLFCLLALCLSVKGTIAQHSESILALSEPASQSIISSIEPPSDYCCFEAVATNCPRGQRFLSSKTRSP